MAKKQKEQMSDETLRQILDGYATSSTNFGFGGKFQQDRIRVDEYYLGEKFGNELPNRSQVVSHDVAEVIDTLMPDMMRIFASSNEAVRYKPTTPEDVEAADQLTDYANYIWWQDNPGFINYHNWFKASMLHRIGVLKIWWDDYEEINNEEYEGLTVADMEILRNDPTVDIMEIEKYPDEGAIIDLMNNLAVGIATAEDLPPGVIDEMGEIQIDHPNMPSRYDVQVKRRRDVGRVRIMTVPPEEFIYDEWAQDIEDFRFVCHRREVTKSDLLQMGFDKDLVNKVEFGYSEDSQILERRERHDREIHTQYRNDEIYDPSSKKTQLYEWYLRVDYDGDGYTEWRKVFTAGLSQGTVLQNEETDYTPFAILSPIPLPFKVVGQSVADKVMDIQLIKSTLWRQSLDNIYLSNNSRYAVSPNVNLDDLLNPKPGGFIRTNSPGSDIVAMTPPQILSNALSMVEYIDTVKEERTGVTRHNQGLEHDSLNKTATGITKLMNAGQLRKELIARVFAETGVKQAFKKIMHLITKYQNHERIIQLRNEWVPVDPRQWKNSFDVSIEVGLGTGDRLEEMERVGQLLSLDQQIITMQGGVQGPIVTIDNVYNKLKALTKASGFKNVEEFYTDPAPFMAQMAQQQQGQGQQQEQPGDAQAQAYLQAEMAKVEQRMQETVMKLQARQQEEIMKLQNQQQQEIMKIEARQQEEIAKISNENAKWRTETALEKEKADREFALKLEELRLKHQEEQLTVGGQDTRYQPVPGSQTITQNDIGEI